MCGALFDAPLSEMIPWAIPSVPSAEIKEAMGAFGGMISRTAAALRCLRSVLYPP